MRILTYPASAIQFRIWTASRPWTCTPRRDPRSYRSSWSRAVLPGTILLKTPQGQGRRSMMYGSRGVGGRAVSKTRSNGVNSTLDSTIRRIMVALARSRCLVAVVLIVIMLGPLHSYESDLSTWLCVPESSRVHYPCRCVVTLPLPLWDQRSAGW